MVKKKLVVSYKLSPITYNLEVRSLKFEEWNNRRKDEKETKNDIYVLYVMCVMYVMYIKFIIHVFHVLHVTSKRVKG